MIKRLFEHVTFILLLWCIGVTLVIGGWLLWPYDVTIQAVEPLPLAVRVLHPGDVIEYNARYTKLMDASGTAAVSLVDGTLVFYPPVVYGGAPGAYDVWGRTFRVPQNVAPGKDYYLQFSVEYRVNPVRTIIERYKTETFEVLEASK